MLYYGERRKCGMSDIQFSGVEDTCFIPFAGRISASKMFPEYFYDEKALQYANLEQVKRVNEGTNEYTTISIATRFYLKDALTREFLEKNKEVNIVCLGAGFETMNYRIQSSSVHYYQIDFESVINHREKLLGKAENETYIIGDITNMSWANQIDKTKPVLFVASGVFLYFEEEVITKLIADLKSTFPGSHLLFDTLDSFAVKIANKIVKKTGNNSALILFSLDDEHKFCEDNNIELISSPLYFEKARSIIKNLKFLSRLAMKMSDKKERAKILLVRL